jgi:hypothetical protein
MLPSQLQELEVKPECETVLSDTEMSDPLSPSRLAIARCVELAYRRGCQIKDLERRAEKELEGEQKTWKDGRHGKEARARRRCLRIKASVDHVEP